MYARAHPTGNGAAQIRPAQVQVQPQYTYRQPVRVQQQHTGGAYVRPVQPQYTNRPYAPLDQRPLDKTDDRDPRLPQRPYPNSYWATPQLLGSEYPAAAIDQLGVRRLERLLDLGVVDFIDLTERGEYNLPRYFTTLEWLAKERGGSAIRMPRSEASAERKRRRHGDDAAVSWADRPSSRTIRYARYAIRDTTVPPQEILQDVLTALAHSRAQGRRAIIHCAGGYGRTGTLVGCWLIYGGYAQDSYESVPNTFAYTRTQSGGTQLRPLMTFKSAGDKALEILKKKWAGVEKSRVAPRTPASDEQVEYVRRFRPPIPVRAQRTGR